MAPVYQAIGAVGAGVGDPISPPLPAGAVSGDLLVAMWYQRDALTPTLPAGWQMAFNQEGSSCRLCAAWKFWQEGDVAPAITRTGTPDMWMGRVVLVRGAKQTGQTSTAGGFRISTGSAQLNFFTAFTMPARSLVFALGSRNSPASNFSGTGWGNAVGEVTTLVTPGVTWTERFAGSTALGADGLFVMNTAVIGEADVSTGTAGAITITGGVAAPAITGFLAILEDRLDLSSGSETFAATESAVTGRQSDALESVVTAETAALALQLSVGDAVAVTEGPLAVALGATETVVAVDGHVLARASVRSDAILATDLSSTGEADKRGDDSVSFDDGVDAFGQDVYGAENYGGGGARVDAALLRLDSAQAVDVLVVETEPKLAADSADLTETLARTDADTPELVAVTETAVVAVTWERTETLIVSEQVPRLDRGVGDDATVTDAAALVPPATGELVSVTERALVEQARDTLTDAATVGETAAGEPLLARFDAATVAEAAALTLGRQGLDDAQLVERSEAVVAVSSSDAATVSESSTSQKGPFDFAFAVVDDAEAHEAANVTTALEAADDTITFVDADAALAQPDLTQQADQATISEQASVSVTIVTQDAGTVSERVVATGVETAATEDYAIFVETAAVQITLDRPYVPGKPYHAGRVRHGRVGRVWRP